MRQRERWISIRKTQRAALLCTFLLAFSLAAPGEAYAQRQPGAVGAGLQVGQPSGVTLKVYRPGSGAYDGVFTTDAEDYASVVLHRLWEHPLPDSPLHLYVGPGILLGAERLGGPVSARLGLSTEAGLNFYAERFEVFLHVTPHLRVLPTQRAQLGGSVGLRYYLRQP